MDHWKLEEYELLSSDKLWFSLCYLVTFGFSFIKSGLILRLN